MKPLSGGWHISLYLALRRRAGAKGNLGTFKLLFKARLPDSSSQGGGRVQVLTLAFTKLLRSDHTYKGPIGPLRTSLCPAGTVIAPDWL